MMHLNEDRAWDQQPGESAKAFRAASIYFGLGADRSIEETRRSLGKSSGFSRVLETWSSRHRWSERARAYDQHMLRIADAAVEAATAEAARRWQERRLEHAERAWEQSQKLTDKASRLIDLPVISKTVSADGKQVTIEAIPPHALRAAAAILKDAALLGWTAIHEALPDDDGSGFDPKEATTEELREIVARAGRRR